MWQSKIGWPCRGYCCCQLCWLCNVRMIWKSHRHAWRHLLGRGIPVVLGKLAVQKALLKAMVLGWLAWWVACCGCLGVVASYALFAVAGLGFRYLVTPFAVILGYPLRLPRLIAFNSVEIQGLQRDWCVKFTLFALVLTVCVKHAMGVGRWAWVSA
jgi:hypothetical protein